jgi:hypothetical protein
MGAKTATGLSDLDYRIRLGRRIADLRERHVWTDSLGKTRRRVGRDEMAVQLRELDPDGHKWVKRDIDALECPEVPPLRGAKDSRPPRPARYHELHLIARFFRIKQAELLMGLGDPGEDVVIRHHATARATATPEQIARLLKRDD